MGVSRSENAPSMIQASVSDQEFPKDDLVQNFVSTRNSPQTGLIAKITAQQGSFGSGRDVEVHSALICCDGSRRARGKV